MVASEKGFLSTMNSSWSQFINQFWQSRLVRSLLAIRIWSIVRAAMQARHMRIAHPFIQFILAAAFVVCRFYSPLQERDRRWKAFDGRERWRAAPERVGGGWCGGVEVAEA